MVGGWVFKPILVIGFAGAKPQADQYGLKKEPVFAFLLCKISEKGNNLHVGIFIFCNVVWFAFYANHVHMHTVLICML